MCASESVSLSVSVPESVCLFADISGLNNLSQLLNRQVRVRETALCVNVCVSVRVRVRVCTCMRVCVQTYR